VADKLLIQIICY